MRKWVPQLRGDRGAPVVHMISASIGEVAACFIRVPTEVIKQRSQASTTQGRLTSLRTMQQVFSEGGLRAFYRGFQSTVAREIPFTCIQFPLYERLKLFFSRRRMSSDPVSRNESATQLTATGGEAALSGSISGSIAAGLTTPLDVCKTRIMLSSSNATGQRHYYEDSISKVMVRIFREEGLGALWKGVGPRVCWIGAGGAVFLGVYDGVKGELVRRDIAS